MLGDIASRTIEEDQRMRDRKAVHSLHMHIFCKDGTRSSESPETLFRTSRFRPLHPHRSHILHVIARCNNVTQFDPLFISHISSLLGHDIL